MINCASEKAHYLSITEKFNLVKRLNSSSTRCNAKSVIYMTANYLYCTLAFFLITFPNQVFDYNKAAFYFINRWRNKIEKFTYTCFFSDKTICKVDLIFAI